MTLRSGVDILEIERLRQALDRHGERFLTRIYTPAERELCAGNPASLAARFAAKEAVSKALGSGLGEVAWTDIEVLRQGSGEPLLRLHGRAAAISNELGLKEWSISLSHSHKDAVALAVALG
jgi:holo-[acyl-carrier protein] synthase